MLITGLCGFQRRKPNSDFERHVCCPILLLHCMVHLYVTVKPNVASLVLLGNRQTSGWVDDLLSLLVYCRWQQSMIRERKRRSDRGFRACLANSWSLGCANLKNSCVMVSCCAGQANLSLQGDLKKYNPAPAVKPPAWDLHVDTTAIVLVHIALLRC